MRRSVRGGYCLTSVLLNGSTASWVLYRFLTLSVMLVVSMLADKHCMMICDLFGRYTYPIYIMSLPVQNIAGILAVKIGIGSTAAYIGLFIAGIVIPYIVAIVISGISKKKYCRWIGYLVGI